MTLVADLLSSILLGLGPQGLHSEVVVLVDIVSQLGHRADYKQWPSRWFIILKTSDRERERERGQVRERYTVHHLSYKWYIICQISGTSFVI